MADDQLGASRASENADAQVKKAREALKQLVRREPERHPLVVALASPLGAPLNVVQNTLADVLRNFGYRVEEIHLSDLLEESPYRPWGELPKRGDSTYYERRMDAGDSLRSEVNNGAALAALAVAKISPIRQKSPPATAFILRSLKHPDEASLLRHIYGDAFSLVAVVSNVSERRKSLQDQLALFEDAAVDAERLIKRDEADVADKDYGQNVRALYAMADMFLPAGSGFDVGPEVQRFVNGIFGDPFITPRPSEEGMKFAFDASLRSAAVGRQVGAALIPVTGTPIVVGTNEVPRPGGGQFWTDDIPDYRDFRMGEDPNQVYVRKLVQDFIVRQKNAGWFSKPYSELSGRELLARAEEKSPDGASLFREARAAALIEFTRCLHAEQASIVNAARSGVTTEKAKIYTTTFPCHECAKFIVGAGVREVLYIEPYPKSLVSRLYDDLIDTEPPLLEAGVGYAGGKVPFRPFVGVAPRRYERVFLAGKRRNADESLASLEPLTAMPRTGGWSESRVKEREAKAVKSLIAILQHLATSAPAEPADKKHEKDRAHDQGPDAEAGHDGGEEEAG